MRSPVDLVDEAPVSTRSRYADLADADVVELAQCGREDAAEHLLYKYRNLVRSKVKSYFLVGAEREDLLQVGMIGLWQAIVDFKPAKGHVVSGVCQGLHSSSHHHGHQSGNPAETDPPQHLPLPRSPLRR